MKRILETLQLIADKLKTVPGITDTGLDIKTQQPGSGVSASVALVSVSYNPQRPTDRFECTITLRAAQSVLLSEFYAYLDATTDEPRSIYRLFRSSTASPDVLSNKAAVIVQGARDIEIRSQDAGGVALRRCVFDVLVIL